MRRKETVTEDVASIRGGVFIWMCALFPVVRAFRALFLSYYGFWTLLLAVTLTLVFSRLTYSLMEYFIRMRTEALEEERGPLWGLVIAGASVFFTEYYDYVSAGSFSSCFKGVLRGSAFASVFVGLLLLAARNLNQYGFGWRKGDILCDWTDMAKNTKSVCGVVGVMVFCVTVFVFAHVLFYGLQLKTWMIVGDAIFSSGVFFLFLSCCRSKIFDFGVRPFVSKVISLDRYNIEKPSAIWGVSFAVHEYAATAVFVGLKSLVFFMLPQVSRSSYLLVLLICVMAGVSILILIEYLDRFRIATRLHAQWRCETIALLTQWHDRHVDAIKSALRGRVVDKFSEEAAQPWIDVAQIRQIADETRRSLNLRFCQCGKMKYLSRYEILDRMKVFSEYARKLFDENIDSLQIDLGVKELDGMTDEQLMRCVDAVKSGREADFIKPVTYDVDKCVSDLRTMVNLTQVVPVCLFPIIFRTDDAVHKFEVLIDERRNVTLVGEGLSGPNVSAQCKYEDLLDVLGLVLDKDSSRRTKYAIQGSE